MKIKKKNFKILLFLRENDEFSNKIQILAKKLFFQCITVVSNNSSLNNKELMLVNKWKGDYIVCFRSKIILSKKIIKKAKIAAINFHPGPPEFRGMGGLNFALFNNIKKYGCTAHIIDEKIDHGKIIDTISFPIKKTDSLENILKKSHKKSFAQCKKILVKLLNQKNYLKKQIKKNSNKSWSKNLFTIKKLNRFYYVNPKINKKNFLKKMRASNTDNFHLYTKIHNKVFKLYDKNYEDLNSKKKLYIYGHGSHVNSVIETARECGQNICGIISEKRVHTKKSLFGIPIMNNNQIKKMNPKDINFIICVGNNRIRSKIFTLLKGKSFKFSTLVHPTAIVSKGAIIKSGTLINANVIINRNVIIDENTIINNDSLIEHDVKIGKNCHVGSSVKIGSGTKISEGSFVGIGSYIKDKIKIGKKVVIGMGSVITKNLNSYKTYVGYSEEIK